MSKRSFRRLSVVAGAALALGSMAPAMAQRIDVAGVANVDATVDLDPVEATSVLSILGPMPTSAQLIQLTTGTLFYEQAFVKGLLHQTLVDVEAIVEAADLGDVLPECSLVAVASCNQGGSNLHIHNNELNILSGNGDLTADVSSTVTNTVENVLNGSLLSGGGNGLPLGLGAVLNVDVLAAVVAALSPPPISFTLGSPASRPTGGRASVRPTTRSRPGTPGSRR